MMNRTNNNIQTESNKIQFRTFMLMVIIECLIFI